MGLDISLSGVMAGLIFGCIGLWMFRRGRQEVDHRLLIIGLALMIYPYFTSGPWIDWGIGLGLCGLAYWWRE